MLIHSNVGHRKFSLKRHKPTKITSLKEVVKNFGFVDEGKEKKRCGLLNPSNQRCKKKKKNYFALLNITLSILSILFFFFLKQLPIHFTTHSTSQFFYFYIQPNKII